ncbi:MAG: anthrone oxygenase family protein [Pseudomonadota bacterium]
MELNTFAFISVDFAILSAVTGGVFQAFSDFVMRGLLAAAPKSGIDAMQMINRTVMRSTFLAILLGLGPASIIFAMYSAAHAASDVRFWIFLATGIYLIGVLGVTMGFNVPMNNRLATLDASAFEAIGYWREYGRNWTRWNHVRTIGCVAASVSYLIAAALSV